MSTIRLRASFNEYNDVVSRTLYVGATLPPLKIGEVFVFDSIVPWGSWNASTDYSPITTGAITIARLIRGKHSSLIQMDDNRNLVEFHDDLLTYNNGVVKRDYLDYAFLRQGMEVTVERNITLVVKGQKGSGFNKLGFWCDVSYTVQKVSLSEWLAAFT